MADFSPDKLIAWAKEHKEIVIPAVLIGGGLGIYVLSKNGGLSAGGTSTGTTPPQAGDPGGNSTTPGAPSGGADYGSAIADLTNQIQASNTSQQSALQQLISQFTGMFNDLTSQTNAALQSQADQTNSALSKAQAAYSQQAAYGDNGLGQLLMQLPQFSGQAQNYAQPPVQLPHFGDAINKITYGDIPLGGTQAGGIRQLNQGAYNVGASVNSFFNSLRSIATRPASAPLNISLPTPGFNPGAYLRNLTPPVRNFTPTPVRVPGLPQVIGAINRTPGRGH